jgi:threonine aldolase
VCLSKGLGAPAGSVLLLPEERLEEARVMRHRMGGGLRQAGILAAAGIYAVEHHVSRLVEDHANATLISRLLTDAGIDATTPETNIVLIRVPDPAHAVTSAAKVGVRISAISDTHVRVVTHLDVASEECREAGRRLAAVLN